MGLRVSQLTKLYPPHWLALDGVTFEANVGVLGLLGPNGAGKSSLMEILSANLIFEAGSVTLDDSIDLKRHAHRWRESIGYLPQSFDFPPQTTGRECLREAAALLGYAPRGLKQRINDLLERVNLAQAADRFADAYSRGMKQRLGLAMALLHEPRLLLLDEPSAGLDPKERIALRELLVENGQHAITVLSTHIVEDVERCCGQVIVMNRGKVLFSGAPSALVTHATGRLWEARISEEALDSMQQDHQVLAMKAEGTKVVVRLLAEEKPTENAVAKAPTLEDGYLALIAKNSETP